MEASWKDGGIIEVSNHSFASRQLSHEETEQDNGEAETEGGGALHAIGWRWWFCVPTRCQQIGGGK